MPSLMKWTNLSSSTSFTALQTGINFDGNYGLSNAHEVWLAPIGSSKWTKQASPAASAGSTFFVPLAKGYIYLDNSGKMHYFDGTSTIQIPGNTILKYVTAGPLGSAYLLHGLKFYGINNANALVVYDTTAAPSDWSTTGLSLPSGVAGASAIQ